MQTFGKRLKQLREEKGMTGQELGKILNVSKVAISNWENDNRFPDKETLIKIADFFNVSLDYLLCRTNIKNAAVFEGKINDDDVHIEYDIKQYPGGLSYEQVVDILEKLKQAGLLPKKDEKPK